MRRIIFSLLITLLALSAWGFEAKAGPIISPEIPPITIPPGLPPSIRCDSFDTTYHTDSFSTDAENYGMTINIGNDDRYDVAFFGRLGVGKNFADLFDLEDEFPGAPDEYRHQKIMVMYDNPSAPEGVAAYPAYCYYVSDDPDNATKGGLIKCFSTAQLPAGGKRCSELIDDYKQDERLVIFTAVRVFGSSDGFCNEGPRMMMKDIIARGDDFGGACTEPPAPAEEAEGAEEGVAPGPTLDPGLGTYTPPEDEIEETGVGVTEGEGCSMVGTPSVHGTQIILLLSALIGIVARRRE